MRYYLKSGTSISRCIEELSRAANADVQGICQIYLKKKIKIIN